MKPLIAGTCSLSETGDNNSSDLTDTENTPPGEGDDSPSNLTDTEDIPPRECDGGSTGIENAPSEEGDGNSFDSADTGDTRSERNDSSSLNEGDSKFWKAFWFCIVLIGMFVMTLALFTVVVPINESGSLLVIKLSSSNIASTVPDLFWWAIILFVGLATVVVFMAVRFEQTRSLFYQGGVIVAAVVFGLLAIVLISYSLKNLIDIFLQHPFITVLLVMFLSLMGATLRLLYLSFKTLCCKEGSEKVAREYAMDTITIASLAGIFLTIVVTAFS